VNRAQGLILIRILILIVAIPIYGKAWMRMTMRMRMIPLHDPNVPPGGIQAGWLRQ